MEDDGFQEEFECPVEENKNGFGPATVPRTVEMFNRQKQRVNRFFKKETCTFFHVLVLFSRKCFIDSFEKLFKIIQCRIFQLRNNVRFVT